VTRAPLFNAVRYENVFPGADLVFHGSDGRLEYDFQLVPGADPGLLGFNFGGGEHIASNPDGSLTLGTSDFGLNLLAPVAYQDDAGHRTSVVVRYRLLAGNRVGFELGSYDHTKPLVIDPVVTYANLYTGGQDADVVAAAADPEGNLILAGYVYSTDYPVINGLAPDPNGSQQVFVTKIDPTGTKILYSTYLPANAFSWASGLAVDRHGSAYYDGLNLVPIDPFGTAIGSDSPLLLSQSGYLSFGTQTIGNPSMARTITASNVSSSNIEAPIVSITGSNQFQMAGNDCSGTLKPQQSCLAAVAFRPTKPGNFAANFNFKGTGGASIPLSGTAQLPAAIIPSALQLQWPALLPGSSSVEALRLTNTSEHEIPVTQISFTLKDYSEINNCHGAVQKLSSCAIEVKFSPRQLGERIDLMQVAFGGVVAPLLAR
jgi:hypothetical protein